MNRRGWIALLFGAAGAQAQQWKECVPDPQWSTKRMILCSNETKAALNNQCPVCGTMAKPYKRQVQTNSYMTCDFPQEALPVCRQTDANTPYGPIERIARCARCNAAFWQDAV